MTTADETIREQLSAWMDGELAPDEARFLERRLAGDADLRRQFERLQLASACLKGQPWRPMATALANDVGAVLASEPAADAVGAGRPRRWAVAASVAALALFVAPGLWRDEGSVAPSMTASAPAANLLPSPASADLVATPVALAAASPESAVMPTPLDPGKSMIASEVEASRIESPLPLDSLSPEEFPLVEAAMQKSWPRSPLATRSDPALEAYLVRHNQMLARDGLGGFVPYVDVVASDKEADAVLGTGAESGADGR